MIFKTSISFYPKHPHTLTCRCDQARLGAVEEDDAQALVTRVFSAYLDLMRKVQTTYWCALLDRMSSRTSVCCCL